MACLLCQSQPIYELSPIGDKRKGASNPHPSTLIPQPSTLNLSRVLNGFGISLACRFFSPATQYRN